MRCVYREEDVDKIKNIVLRSCSRKQGDGSTAADESTLPLSRTYSLTSTPDLSYVRRRLKAKIPPDIEHLQHVILREEKSRRGGQEIATIKERHFLKKEYTEKESWRCEAFCRLHAWLLTRRGGRDNGGEAANGGESASSSFAEEGVTPLSFSISHEEAAAAAAAASPYDTTAAKSESTCLESVAGIYTEVVPNTVDTHTLMIHRSIFAHDAAASKKRKKKEGGGVILPPDGRTMGGTMRAKTSASPTFTHSPPPFASTDLESILRSIRPKSALYLAVLDVLCGNYRHGGNILIRHDGWIVGIDHTYAFSTNPSNWGRICGPLLGRTMRLRWSFRYQTILDRTNIGDMLDYEKLMGRSIGTDFPQHLGSNLRALNEMSDVNIETRFGIRGRDTLSVFRRRLQSLLSVGLESTVDSVVKARDVNNQKRIMRSVT
eukprot:g2931.t1